jgi:hypothetical protein
MIGPGFQKDRDILFLLVTRAVEGKNEEIHALLNFTIQGLGSSRKSAKDDQKMYHLSNSKEVSQRTVVFKIATSNLEKVSQNSFVFNFRWANDRQMDGWMDG